LKAPSGVENGERVSPPPPSRDLRERCEIPQRGPGRAAPAENDLGASGGARTAFVAILVANFAFFFARLEA